MSKQKIDAIQEALSVLQDLDALKAEHAELLLVNGGLRDSNEKLAKAEAAMFALKAEIHHKRGAADDEIASKLAAANTEARIIVDAARAEAVSEVADAKTKAKEIEAKAKEKAKKNEALADKFAADVEAKAAELSVIEEKIREAKVAMYNIKQALAA